MNAQSAGTWVFDTELVGNFCFSPRLRLDLEQFIPQPLLVNVQLPALQKLDPISGVRLALL